MLRFDGKFSFSLWAFLVLTLVNANYNDADIESVFYKLGAVPDVIPIPPSLLLKVTYGYNLAVNKGNELTPTQVKDQPKVEYYADEKSYYTLIMVDPDAPSRADPTLREVKHWLVVNILGNNVEQGEVLAAYRGSGPPKGTGLHRYIFMLFKQPEKLIFNEETIPSNSTKGRFNFKTAEFVEKYKLGIPIAGNLYRAKYDDYVPILQALTVQH